jgi:hypothetical protein
MIYRGPCFLAVVCFGFYPTPATSPVSEMSLSNSSCVSLSPFELTDGREGDEVEEEAESYDGEKAWSSINNSILSDWSCPFRSQKQTKKYKNPIFCCRCHRLHPPPIVANLVRMASSVLVLLLHSSQFLNPKKTLKTSYVIFENKV